MIHPRLCPGAKGARSLAHVRTVFSRFPWRVRRPSLQAQTLESRRPLHARERVDDRFDGGCGEQITDDQRARAGVQHRAIPAVSHVIAERGVRGHCCGCCCRLFRSSFLTSDSTPGAPPHPPLSPWPSIVPASPCDFVVAVELCVRVSGSKKGQSRRQRTTRGRALQHP